MKTTVGRELHWLGGGRGVIKKLSFSIPFHLKDTNPLLTPIADC